MRPAAALHLVSPPAAGIARIGYQPDPFLWRDPKLLSDEDGGGPGPLLAGNRFDAPNREFRTLYFADNHHGAWLERLSRVLPLRDAAARIDAALDDEDPDPEFDVPLTPGIDTSFFEKMVIGEARIADGARFIDVEHSTTLNTLNERLGLTFLTPFGWDRFDRGVPLNRDRRMTRQLAGHLYTVAKDDPDIVGLRWGSVHAGGSDCWALWEKGVSSLYDHALAPVDLTTPALRDAATILNLEIPSAPLPTPLPDGFPEPW
jgi:RES domain